jgi:hypothetical protein
MGPRADDLAPIPVRWHEEWQEEATLRVALVVLSFKQAALDCARKQPSAQALSPELATVPVFTEFSVSYEERRGGDRNRSTKP